jgi:hypothetical protein
MARCYETCKYNVCGFCRKYHEAIHVSKVWAHQGLPLHPLEYLEVYYKSDQDVEHLIKVAEEFMTDNISKNICQQFKTKGYISYKQRRYLVYNLLHCAEDRGKWIIKSV